MPQITFWEDKQKNIIQKDLLSNIASVCAKEVFESTKSKDKLGNIKTDKRGGVIYSDKLNKSSQIRKFFDEVIKYKTDLLAHPAAKEEDLIFKQKLPYIKMINAKLAYAKARDLITDDFKDLFTNAINKIEDRADFFVFSDFFEAFVAFYKQYNSK